MNRKNLIVFDDKGNVASKQCGTCRDIKPISEFYARDLYSRHVSQRHQSRCKRCQCPNYGKSRAAEDLTGRKFNLLTVRGRDGKLFIAKCECGGEIKVRASNIKSGNTKSCGCLRKLVGNDHKFRVKTRYAWECG